MKSECFWYIPAIKRQNLKLKTKQHLHQHPKKLKYLSINIPKYVKDLYEESYKTLMNKVKELNSFSLAALWQRIHLPMQETGVQSSDYGRSHMPQSNKVHTITTEPVRLEPVSCNKRSHCNEKPMHHDQRVAPAHHNQRKLHTATKTQHSQK